MEIYTYKQSRDKPSYNGSTTLNRDELSASRSSCITEKKRAPGDWARPTWRQWYPILVSQSDWVILKIRTDIKIDCKATWFRDSCPAWMAAKAALTLTAAAVEPLLDVTWLLTPELGELDVPFAWPLPPELRWDTSVTYRKYVSGQVRCVVYTSKVANKQLIHHLGKGP